MLKTEESIVVGKRLKCEQCENHFLIVRPDNPKYVHLSAVPFGNGEYYVSMQFCNGVPKHLNFLYWNTDARTKETVKRAIIEPDKITECIIPREVNDVENLQDLENFLASHEWRFKKTEKFESGLIFEIQCERCNVKRVLTLVSTKKLREQLR